MAKEQCSVCRVWVDHLLNVRVPVELPSSEDSRPYLPWMPLVVCPNCKQNWKPKDD